jgi:hypothetical protein
VSALKPLTPPFRKTTVAMIEEEIDTPLSMDDDDDLANAGSSHTGTLTPPMSPLRGPADYITPRAGDRTSRSPVFQDLDKLAPLPGSVPDFPSPNVEYVRRRSRSVDDQDKATDEDEDEGPLFVADARRATHLPEHGHKDEVIDSLIKDESKTPLVVNRTLYRAHRQMRLAVLEASKRFEEQQAQRARDILTAEEEGKEAEAMGTYGAGLVMRHGQKKSVTSEAVRTWLIQNEKRQAALVEKANKRCGRGRRTRKKTISDMSGMLASMNSEEASGAPLSSISTDETGPSSSPSKMSDSTLPDGPLADGVVRDATVPGVFRKTVDPFSKNGLYGHV